MSNSHWPSITHKFFYSDPGGDGMMFFDTEAERDKAMSDAIAAWSDDGWSEEVENICAGVVTHTVEKCDVQNRPERCTEHEDQEEPDCDQCGENQDWVYGGDVDYICNYKAVPLATPSTDASGAEVGA